MSKAVMISIRPEWCEKIASGKKTVEVRKTRPMLEPPFKCYIYCTNTRPFLVWADVFRGDWDNEFTHISGYGREEAERIWDVFNGKVIGEFVCTQLYYISADVEFGVKHLYNTVFLQNSMCMSNDDLFRYLYRGKGKKNDGWGWAIRDLVIYDTPKVLSDWYRFCEDNQKCEGCEWFTADINKYGEIYKTCGSKYEGMKPLYSDRPPQSWCYVEELEVR